MSADIWNVRPCRIVEVYRCWEEPSVPIFMFEERAKQTLSSACSLLYICLTYF
jgi:hypothetical protein